MRMSWPGGNSPWSRGRNRPTGSDAVAAATGRRSAALQQYEICRRRLRDELGIEPDRATQALYQQIKASTGEEADRAGAAAWRASPGGPARGSTTGADPQLRDIPRLPLLARERELAWLDARLAQVLDRQGQVVLVTGSSGSGKSALLVHFARVSPAADPHLVVAGSHFNMMGNLGGLSVFVEILRLLTADLTAFRTASEATNEHFRHAQPRCRTSLARLRDRRPGPHRIPGGLGERRCRRRGSRPHAARRPASGAAGCQAAAPARPSQADLFDQFVRTLRTFARTHPLIILLGDLQWMGQDAANLVFHFASSLGAQPDPAAPELSLRQVAP